MTGRKYMGKTKICTNCKGNKCLSEFPKNKKSKDGYGSWCKQCHSNKQLQWHKNHPEQAKLRRALSIDTNRIIALQIYSDGKMCCDLCGESDIDVLCIDHIYGGGNKHRKKCNLHGGESIYLWLRKNCFPTGFRVLCRNCNHKESLRLNSNLTYDNWDKVQNKC